MDNFIISQTKEKLIHNIFVLKFRCDLQIIYFS